MVVIASIDSEVGRNKENIAGFSFEDWIDVSLCPCLSGGLALH
jgi:hypothetical protein